VKRCPQCGQQFDDSVQFCPVDGAKPIAIGGGVAEDPFVGVVLGNKYRIEKKIGEGGMGKIYLSRHITLNKRYAIKMLNPEFSNNQEAIERFRREAVAAAELDHPNIINVTDIDYSAQDGRGGQAYIVMEFLDGRELRAALRQSPVLPLQRSLRILYQVARALDAAHAKGIIHRDLKPENIFLVDRADQKDVAKILDFGISKIKGARASNLTQTGMVIGTPHYMAPEQARGDRNVDHRVDVYALGAIAYEMMTGNLPVNGDSPTAILMKILLEEPAPPEFFNPTISPPLSAAIKRAMAKDPNDRFASCGEFIDALRLAAQVNPQEYTTSSFAAPSMQQRVPTASPQRAAMPSGQQQHAAPPMRTPPPGQFRTGMPQGYASQQQPMQQAYPPSGPYPPQTGSTPMTWSGPQQAVAPQIAAPPPRKSGAAIIVVPVILVLFLGAAAAAGLFAYKKYFSGPPATEGGPATAGLTVPNLTTGVGGPAAATAGTAGAGMVAPAVTATQVPIPPAEEKVFIKFSTDPTAATVLLQVGGVEKELCKSECTYGFNRSDKKLKITFTKQGYQDEEMEITPDVPHQGVKVNLTKVGRKKASGGGPQVTTGGTMTLPPPPQIIIAPPPEEKKPVLPPPEEKKPGITIKEKKGPIIRPLDSTSPGTTEKKKPIIKIIPSG